MINFDVSKALNSQHFSYLTPVIPGLFFEICFYVGNPEKVFATTSRLHLEKGVIIVLSLFLAFVVGSAFFLWVRLIQDGIKTIQIILSRVWSRFLNFTTTGSKYPWLQKLKLRALRNRFIARSQHKQNLAQCRATAKAWRVVATRIFVLYGIDPLDAVGQTGAEWRAWQAALAPFKPEDFRGNRWVIAIEAVGWSGFICERLFPILNTPYFLAFCWFTISNGLLHDWTVAKRVASPEISWSIGLYRIVEELKSVLKITRPSAGEHNEQHANRE
jgi:hypothetical protein